MNARTIRLGLAFALVCSVWLAPVGAQPMGAQGEDFLYKVEPADTLEALSLRYTQNASNWRELQQINHIEDPYRVPIGFVLRIPFRLIPEVPGHARVVHVTGEVTIEGRSLQAGDTVTAGQALHSGPAGVATLKLPDDSLLTLSPDSTLILDRLHLFQGTGLTDSILKMNDGSLESIVAPGDTGVGRFEVRTPVTVTGVRGTRLRVSAAADGVRNEVVQGTMAIDTPKAAEFTIRQGQGAAIGPTGENLGIRALLPAPNLPVPKRTGGQWGMTFPPVPGAQAYRVRVTSDPDGALTSSTSDFTEPTVQFSANKPGTHYVFVRAIDDLGLGGIDAGMPFEGRIVLQTSDGRPVLSGSGQAIGLGET
ncbi:MAG: FecR domain-containing protein [Alcaligenaceae bacterium]|nr:FecR domain-containing protein [Alcaligenaceae bacterium]